MATRDVGYTFNGRTKARKKSKGSSSRLRPVAALQVARFVPWLGSTSSFTDIKHDNDHGWNASPGSIVNSKTGSCRERGWQNEWVSFDQTKQLAVLICVSSSFKCISPLVTSNLLHCSSTPYLYFTTHFLRRNVTNVDLESRITKCWNSYN